MLICSEPDFLSTNKFLQKSYPEPEPKRDFDTQPISQVSKNRHISMQMHSPSVWESAQAVFPVTID